MSGEHCPWCDSPSPEIRKQRFSLVLCANPFHETAPTPPAQDVETLDLSPFIDALAKAQYEDFDSHAATMTWDEYKADDYVGARALYIDPMGMFVRRALPTLGAEVARLVQEARGEALREAKADIRHRIEVFRSVGGSDQYLNALNDAHGLVANRERAVRPVPGERSEAGE